MWATKLKDSRKQAITHFDNFSSSSLFLLHFRELSAFIALRTTLGAPQNTMMRTEWFIFLNRRNCKAIKHDIG